ncbi:MAG: YceI family protein [Pseudomonadota bacterium]
MHLPMSLESVVHAPRTLLACAAAMLLALPGYAQWSLDNDRSQLNFISIKAGNIAESHTFTQLSGDIADSGTVKVAIALLSVDTKIPIRDERMKEFLFESNIFPTATITANIAPQRLAGLQPGETTRENVNGTLAIKDRSIDMSAEITASRTTEHTLVVATSQPILVNSAALGLGAGVEKLRELAGLPSISQAVPVTFVLTFHEIENTK